MLLGIHRQPQEDSPNPVNQTQPVHASSLGGASSLCGAVGAPDAGYGFVFHSASIGESRR
jgi:hypothetical protein